MVPCGMAPQCNGEEGREGSHRPAPLRGGSIYGCSPFAVSQFGGHSWFTSCPLGSSWVSVSPVDPDSPDDSEPDSLDESPSVLPSVFVDATTRAGAFTACTADAFDERCAAAA